MAYANQHTMLNFGNENELIFFNIYIEKNAYICAITIKSIRIMVIHENGLSYSVINEHDVKVLGFYPRREEKARIVIPPHVEGYRVAVIAKKAFYECTKLRQVVLPAYLHTIEEEAFGLCDKLEDIVLPESVRHIGKGAFEGTLALRKVVLPSTLAALPEALFYDSAVSDVTLPEGIGEIPAACFYDCRNLRRIVLPAGVAHVAHDAFHYCVNLAEVVAPEAIDHIDMFDGEKEWQIKPLKR